MSVSVKGASICLIGAGRMGGALLRGWLAAGVPPKALTVQEPNPSPEVAQLVQQLSIASAARETPDVLVLAVKPQNLPDVLKQAAIHAGPKTVTLSIAAGRTVASIAQHLPSDSAIVRAMPNLPAEIGRGIAALFANAHVTADQKELCETLMRAVGDAVWIADESLMDAITAVSGSGPAYLFYFLECLTAAARDAGLPDDLASELAKATVTGSAELLSRSVLSAAQLRENVTSPGGTTAAGLSVLMREGGLKELLAETVKAAARRSRELSQ